MAKLYVAKLVILNPNDLSSCSNKLQTYETEHILVKRKMFGYQEVFTKHGLHKKDVIKESQSWDNDVYPFIIVSDEIYNRLKEGQMQFVLDRTRSFPMREAEEKDAKKYIKEFENSTLKKYYEQEDVEINAEIEERKREKASKKAAKRLIKESKYNK